MTVRYDALKRVIVAPTNTCDVFSGILDLVKTVSLRVIDIKITAHDFLFVLAAIGTLQFTTWTLAVRVLHVLMS